MSDRGSRTTRAKKNVNQEELNPAPSTPAPKRGRRNAKKSAQEKNLDKFI